MIKFYLTFILISAAVFAKAQDTTFPLDSISKKASYSEVVNVTGKSDQLYNKALEWFAVYFASSNDVIQIKDKEAGKIVAKFIIGNINGIPPTSATFIVYLKDDRYKYSINDIIYTGGNGSKSWGIEERLSIWQAGLTKSGIKSVKSTASNVILHAVSSLKEHMTKKEDSNF